MIIISVLGAQDNFTGRLSLSTYANYTNGLTNLDRLRFKPRLSFEADNIAQSKFSLSGYINADYRQYRNREQFESSEYLRVYNLAILYDLNETTSLTLGRKINQRLSNIGVIDGLQIDKSWERFSSGVIIGSRPDIDDFGLNLNLFEAGLYIGYGNKNSESTLAITQQMNGRSVDRRCLYFSHHNRISDKLRYFINSDIDLYKSINGITETTFRLTGLYLSATYKPFKKLSLTTAYNSRKNVIYYQTFKTYAEQLYDDETRQGIKFRANWKPLRFMYMGTNAGYRIKSGDDRSSYNYSFYVGHSNILRMKLLTRMTVSRVISNYLDGNIYNIYLSKNIFKNNVTISSDVKYIDYYYLSSGTSLIQKQVSGNIAWQLKSKISFTLSYIGNFEELTDYNQLYFIISQKF